MTVDDGFGDTLSINEVLARKNPLLEVMARERGRTDLDFADTVQEARIAMWQVLEKRPDAPPAYLHGAARTRMTEFIARGKATGQPSQQGKASIDPLRRADRDSLDDPDVTAVVVAAEVLDGVMLAYHDGDILRAINALPVEQREYVYLRFWRGMSNAEIAAKVQASPRRVEQVWREITRPRLARMLHHLADAV